MITLSIDATDARAFARDPHLLALLVYLRATRGDRTTFAVPNDLCEGLGWTLRRLTAARRSAVEGGWIRQLCPPMAHTPAQYAWGRRR